MELEYKIKQGQSLFDVSNINLYGLDNIVLGLLRPSGKSFTDEPVNVNVVYDNNYVQDNTIQLQLDVPAVSPIYSVNGLENQSIFDLCIMNYGNLDKLTEMIKDNSNIVSINDINVSEKSIIFNSNKLTEAYVQSIIKSKRYTYATIARVYNEDLVWDGYFDIWDGVFDLGY